MAVDNLPRVTRHTGKTPAEKTVTLADLRELVEAAALLPPSTIVRVNSIPFHMPDLGNPKGGRCMQVALDYPDDET